MIDLIFVIDQLFRLQSSEHNCVHVTENLQGYSNWLPGF